MAINMFLCSFLVCPGSVTGYTEFVTSLSYLLAVPAMHCSQNDLSFPGPPLGVRYLISTLSPGSRTPKHGPVCYFLSTTFSFLSEDFANAVTKISSSY